jgi:hypothetical protein
MFVSVHNERVPHNLLLFYRVIVYIGNNVENASLSSMAILIGVAPAVGRAIGLRMSCATLVLLRSVTAYGPLPMIHVEPCGRSLCCMTWPPGGQGIQSSALSTRPVSVPSFFFLPASVPDPWPKILPDLRVYPYPYYTE